MKARCAGLWAGLFLAGWMLAGCGPDTDLAGGTGIETTNGIAGAVFAGDAPVGAARVAAYPEGFNPYRDTLSDSLRAVTDAEGRFEIRRIPPGRYNVLAESAPAGPAAMTLAVPVASRGKTFLLNHELRPRGAVRVPRGEGVAQGAGYVYIPGTPWLVAMSDAEGSEDFVLLEGVAAAEYVQIRFVGGDRELDTNLLAAPLAVEPGDTVTLSYLEKGWAHTRNLTFNTTATGADVAGDVAGFPVLVRLDSIRFDFTQARPGGEDIRFASSDGLPLPYQIERWDGASKVAEIWVRVGRIRGNSQADYISMWWGRPQAEDASDPRRAFQAADGFVGVWHLGEEQPGDGGFPIYRNSADDANHGLDFIKGDDRGGAIGYGKGFDGSDYIHMPVATSILKPTVNITVSGWYKATVCDTGGASIASMGDSWGLKMDQNGKTRLFAYIAGSPRSPLTALSVLDGKWHLLTGSYDGNATRSYVDGVFLASDTDPGVISYVLGADFFIGKHGNGLSNVDAIGNIDEVQVSAAARSADWIKLSYETQRPDSKLIQY